MHAPRKNEPDGSRSDLSLIREARSGAAEAVDEFLERMRCIPRILRLKNARLGQPLSDEDLDDLAQEIFALVWRKIDSFRGEAALTTWVGRFCINTLMNSLRSKGRTPRSLGELTAPIPDHRSSVSTDGEQTSTIRAALARLDPAYGRVVELRQFDELSFEEIAARLDLPVATVKTRYYRGLDKLRELLRPHFTRTEGKVS